MQLISRAAEPLQRRRAVGVVGAAVDGDGGDAGAVEHLGHVVGVLDRDAEADGPHLLRAGDLVAEFADHLGGAGVVAGVEVAQLRGVVVAALPLQLAEVDVVRDAEVVERHQQIGVQGVPEAQFAGGAAVEELLGDVDAVAAFRRRGQSEELLRLQVVQQPAVGGRHGVVEFIDDDDVEEVRFQLFDAEG